MTLSGTIAAWVVLRRDLFDLIPVARETLMEKLADGVIVLDERARIIDVNPAAARALALASPVVGAPAAAVLAPWPISWPRSTVEGTTPARWSCRPALPRPRIASARCPPARHRFARVPAGHYRAAPNRTGGPPPQRATRGAWPSGPRSSASARNASRRWPAWPRRHLPDRLVGTHHVRQRHLA